MVEGSKKQKRTPSIRKTRKHKIQASVEGGIQRIPELKKAFDQLNQEVAEILRSGEKGPTRIKRFQQCWRKLFGRPVDKAAAEAYLEAKVRSRRRSDGTRKQKGGMAPLSGAPLDYQTRPGIDGVHGSFVPYVGPREIAQFDAVTTQDSIAAQCGKVDTTPAIGVGMGSNLVTMEGGAPSVLGDMSAYLSGRAAAASPDPSQKAFQYM